jgi:DNA-binding MarR family transcriptional regulator
MPDDPSTWATGRLISHVARGLERRWNNHLDDWGLNHASLPVLLHLLHGGRSQREIATLSNVTEQTMSRTVARLERLGYVARTPDPTDARRQVVHLTDTGRTVAADAARPEQGEAIASAGLSPEQLAALREILVDMVRAQTPDTQAPDAQAPDAEADPR